MKLWRLHTSEMSLISSKLYIFRSNALVDICAQMAVFNKLVFVCINIVHFIYFY